MAPAEAANSFYRSYDNPSRSCRNSSRLTHVLKWCHSPINAQPQQLWYQKPAPDNWLRFCRKHLCAWTSFHKLCSFFWAPYEWGCQTCRSYTPRKIRLILKSPNLRILLFLKTSWMIDLHGFVIFVESLRTFIQTVSSCKLLSEQISQKYLCLKHKILWYLLVSW